MRRGELLTERRLLQVTTFKANFIETSSTVSEEDEQQKCRAATHTRAQSGGVPVSETCGGGGSSVGWVWGSKGGWRRTAPPVRR